MTAEDPWKAAETYTWEQDMARGPWPTQRTSRMPDPPWPSPDNPMLAALLHDARKNMADGMSADVAMLQLATHCLVRRRHRGLRPRPAGRSPGTRTDLSSGPSPC